MTIPLSDEVLKQMGFEPQVEGDYYVKDNHVIHKFCDKYNSLDKHKNMVTLETKEDLMIFMSRVKDWITVVQHSQGDITFSVNADKSIEAERKVADFIKAHPDIIGAPNVADIIEKMVDGLDMYSYGPKRNEECANCDVPD
jgi:hypothetical protein